MKKNNVSNLLDPSLLQIWVVFEMPDILHYAELGQQFFFFKKKGVEIGFDLKKKILCHKTNF